MSRLMYCSVAALLFLVSANPAQAQDRHYVVVFGAQRMPPEPRHSHSYGVFVHETCSPAGKRIDSIGISWLPCTGVVRLNTLLPEAGRNWGIHETFRWCYDNDMRVSMWGPYEIEPELYFSAVKQYHVLQSGQVKYKAVDSGYPTSRVSNCIHALSSVATGYRLRVASPGWGETASYAVTLRFEPYFINPEHKHTWLLLALGLGQYPIIHRDLEEPRSGAVWSLLRSATHHDEKLPPTQILGEAPLVPGPVPVP